jgi:hypothetical protein
VKEITEEIKYSHRIFLCRQPEGTGNLEDVDVSGRILLKWNVMV